MRRAASKGAPKVGWFHAIAGGAVLSGSTAASYYFASSHQSVQDTNQPDAVLGQTVFDTIAAKYDAAIGSEVRQPSTGWHRALRA